MISGHHAALRSRLVSHIIERVPVEGRTRLELWYPWMRNDGSFTFFNADGADLYSGLGGVLLALTKGVPSGGWNQETELVCRRIFSIIAANNLDFSPRKSGFFDGFSGALYASLCCMERMSALSEEPEFLKQPIPLYDLSSFQTMDLIGGYLGYAAGVAMLTRIRGGDDLKDMREQVFMELESLPVDALMFAVDSDGCQIQTGMAHGTSGAILVLHEYAKIFDSKSLRQKAWDLLEVENNTFVPEFRNWTDWRHKKVQHAGSLSNLPEFPLMWCTGAPGGLMVRRRLYQDTGDTAALVHTAEAVRGVFDDMITENGGNWSLCHGFLGNLMSLAGFEQLLSTDEKACLERKLAGGLEQFESGTVFPIGINDQRIKNDDGLMCGTSGLLYYLGVAESEDHLLVPRFS